MNDVNAYGNIYIKKPASFFITTLSIFFTPFICVVYITDFLIYLLIELTG